MSMAEDLRREALELDYAYRQVVKGIRADEAFSDSFKAQRLAQEAAKYAKALEALQESAERMLTGRRSTVQKRLAELAEAEVARQRALLGDSTLLTIWRDRLAVLEPEKVVSMAQEAAGDWPRAVLFELASNEIAKRLREPNAPEAVHKAHYDLRSMAGQAAPEVDALQMELHELRDIPGFVAKLDVPAERQEFAAKMRLNPEYVEFAA